MNLNTICGHTVDLDLLPEAPHVIDVGARRFEFSRAMLRHRPKASIIAFEPDRSVRDPEEEQIIRLNYAVVGDDRETDTYYSYSSGDGNCLRGDTRLTPYPEWKAYEVRCLRLSRGPWDLVKLDCEGSEFGILEHWSGPIAKQITVEFHDWNCRDLYPDSYYADLFAGPLKDYEVVQHELSEQGGHSGHWDTVLRLKNA